MRGAAQARLGRLAEALSDLDTGLTIAPDDAWALKQRGVIKLMLKNFAGALLDFDAALTINPFDEWAVAQRKETQRQQLTAEKARLEKINDLFASGVKKYESDNHTGALEDFNAILALDPKHAETLAIRGASQAGLGRLTEALSDLNTSLSIAPNDAWPLGQRGVIKFMLKDFIGALADFDASLKIEPVDEWVIIHRAEAQRQFDEKQRKIAAAKKAAKDQLKRINAFFDSGITKYKSNDHASAIKNFNAVLELDPKHAEALKMRGAAQAGLGRLTEALSDLNTSLSIAPNDAWTLGQRGEVKQELKDYIGALADFDASLKIEPIDEWVIIHRAEAQRQFDEKQRKIAAAKREKRINALFDSGITKYKSNDHAGAIKNFNAVLALDSQHAESLRMRGLVHVQLNQLMKALSDLNASLRIAPKNARALRARGEVERRLKFYVAALADFNTSLKIEPSHKWAINQLALTQQQLAEAEKISELTRSGKMKYARGDNAGAIQDFNAVLRLDPKHAESLKMRKAAQLKLDQLAEEQQKKAAAQRTIEREKTRIAAPGAPFREISGPGSSTFFSSTPAPSKKQGIFFECNDSYYPGGFTIELYRDGSLVDSTCFVNRKINEWDSSPNYYQDKFWQEVRNVPSNNYMRAAEYFYEARTSIAALQASINEAFQDKQDADAAAAAQAEIAATAAAEKEQKEKEEKMAAIKQQISVYEYHKEIFAGDTSYLDSQIQDLKKELSDIEYGKSSDTCCVM